MFTLLYQGDSGNALYTRVVARRLGLEGDCADLRATLRVACSLAAGLGLNAVAWASLHLERQC